jgi:hypothetical protein
MKLSPGNKILLSIILNSDPNKPLNNIDVVFFWEALKQKFPVYKITFTILNFFEITFIKPSLYSFFKDIN